MLMMLTENKFTPKTILLLSSFYPSFVIYGSKKITFLYCCVSLSPRKTPSITIFLLQVTFVNKKPLVTYLVDIKGKRDKSQPSILELFASLLFSFAQFIKYLFKFDNFFHKTCHILQNLSSIL